MVLICQWHEDAGFCIDELRTPTLWCEIPGGVDQISQLGALIQAAHSYWIAIGAPGAVGEKGDVF